MRISHARVIAQNGLVSVWLESASARVYAALPRIKGFVQDLVTIEEAEAYAAEREAEAIAREREHMPYFPDAEV